MNRIDHTNGPGPTIPTVAILPAFNLESGIADIVRRTQRYVGKVVVVADGSWDRTATRARQAGAVVPEPLSIRGKGFAVIKGVDRAKKFKAEVVVLMDADGQHLPEEIPQLVAPLKDHKIDMVVGSRMLGTLRTSTINRFGNLALKMLSFGVTRRWLTDTESGFRAFRAARLFELPLRSRGYEIESELLLRALHDCWNIVEVPINVPFAVPGITVWDGMKVGYHKLRLSSQLWLKKRRVDQRRL